MIDFLDADHDYILRLHDENRSLKDTQYTIKFDAQSGDHSDISRFFFSKRCRLEDGYDAISGEILANDDSAPFLKVSRITKHEHEDAFTILKDIYHIHGFEDDEGLVFEKGNVLFTINKASEQLT